MPRRAEKHVVIRGLLEIERGEGLASSAEKYNGLPYEVSTESLTDGEAADLKRDKRVKHVLPSVNLSLIEPLDLHLSQSAEARDAWGIAAVGADGCEEVGRGVSIAILDSGIDDNHVAFGKSNRVLIDFVADPDGKENSAPDEPHGHGTHVAGIAFGGEVDGKRIGVASGIDRALIAKVVGPNGAAIEAIIEGLNWALKKKADIISMSLGFDFSSLVARMVACDYPLTIAVSRALASYRETVGLFDDLAKFIEGRAAEGRGAILIAASGNGSLRHKDARFTAAVVPPAASLGFISVGAVSRLAGETPAYVVSPFSNTGCQLVAPGEHILSARAGKGLRTLSGTSMAAPHVAGIAALWLQRLFPDSRPKNWIGDVRRELQYSALRIPGDREDVGLGLVQAPPAKARS